MGIRRNGTKISNNGNSRLEVMLLLWGNGRSDRAVAIASLHFAVLTGALKLDIAKVKEQEIKYKISLHIQKISVMFRAICWRNRGILSR